MKKVFSAAIIAILSLTVILYSCQKPNEFTTKLNNTSTSYSSMLSTSELASLNSIGLIHNEAMDYGYQFIQENNSFHGLSEDEVFPLMKSITSSYYENNYNTLGINALNVSNYLADLHSYPPTIPLELNDAINELEVIYDGANNPEEFEPLALDFLNEKCQILSDENNKIILKSSVLVLINSYKYWDANYSKWNTLFEHQNNLSNNGSSNKQKLDGKGIAWSDLGGALVGGVKGAIGGAVLGVGVGAGVGALWGAAWGATEASFTAVGIEIIRKW